MEETILILDFGAQYVQLIARASSGMWRLFENRSSFVAKNRQLPDHLWSKNEPK
jgi:GMP synthase-like glutamine amidotransferase